jgi:hypothetical protein
MPKLHEVLAVEQSLSIVAKKLSNESVKTLGKDNLFTGEVKTHTMFADDAQHLVQAPMSRTVTTTVKENLHYLFHQGLSPYWDAVAQKDDANQRAVADIKIGDEVIATNVAGTTLLGLESKLSALIEVFNAMPTLAPGINWEVDVTQPEGVFKNTMVEERMQAVKVPDHKVLYPATDRHPAQIEKFERIENIGKFSLVSFSGMVSPVEKARLIKRLQTLISAVKQARQRANCVEVHDVHIGEALTGYLFAE